MRGLLGLSVAWTATAWLQDEALRLATEQRSAAAPRRLQLDLAQPPEMRWNFLAQEPGFQDYRAQATAYLEKYIPKHLLPVVDDITKHMERAYYHDYGLEMKSISQALNLSLGEVVLMNLVYQVEQIGTACYKVNTTGPCPSAPGLCSAFLADAETSVWQGRNLDWDLDEVLLPYVVEVDYQRAGKTIFRGLQVVGMIGVLHGMAPNHFSVQINARDRGGSAVENLFEELLLGGKTPTHVARRALEQYADFASAQSFLGSERLANPVYFILSGTAKGEGAILTRSRTSSDAWHLHEQNPKDLKGINRQPDWFRFQTNYDPWLPVPSYDDRRSFGVRSAEEFCKEAVNATTVLRVMTQWPQKNHHTDITSVMCASSGFMSTMVWSRAPASSAAAPAALVV